MKAFAWRSGQIGLGRSVPEGALMIAEGPPRVLRRVMDVFAREDYRGGYLVPGIPEARSDEEAGDALAQFMSGVAKHLKKVSHAQHP